MTVIERKGTLAGLTVAYLGDGANNMGHSYLLGGATAGMHVRIGAPAGYQPEPTDRRRRRGDRRQDRRLGHGHRRPGRGDCGSRRRHHRHLGLDGPGEREGGAAALFGDYAISVGALATAAPEAIVLHCLPAYRGLEIAAEVLDGPQSVVWDEAENRLHAQKALMIWLLERTGEERV